jgi:hypothetical protein
MRRAQRIVLLTTLTLVMPILAGCADFDMDKLDIFHLNEKKKLPGERKPLFPEGVPGVTQGIPQEYMKGNVQEQTGAAPPPLPAEATPAAEPQKQAAAPTEEPKPKAKAEIKAKPKPKKTAKLKPKPKPKTPPAAAPAEPASQQASPAPWPAAPAPAQGQTPATAPWPAAPPPGTFSH